MVGKLDLDGIAAHIADAEAKTTGEIVCVLAKQSDDYQYIPALWAALLSLSVPLIFILVDFVIGSNGWAKDVPIAAEIIYLTQLAVFVVGFLVAKWPPLKMVLVPRYIKQRRAARLAAEQFMRQEIHLTDQHTGVLLFISLSEHYVEVIADHGIYQKLDAAIWQDLVDDLITNIKRNQMDAGIITAIDQIGVLLAGYFPSDGKVNDNELPDHLILLN